MYRKLVAMTVFEGVPGALWLVYVIANGIQYTTEFIAVSAVLFLGVAVESIAVTESLHRRAVAFGAAFGFVEVFVWVQGAIYASTGLYSAQGIGPATVTWFVLFVPLHAAESGVHFREMLRVRHVLTAGVEAVSLIVAWILIADGAAVAGLFALLVGLGVEHATRLSDVAG